MTKRPAPTFLTVCTRQLRAMTYSARKIMHIYMAYPNN